MLAAGGTFSQMEHKVRMRALLAKLAPAASLHALYEAQAFDYWHDDDLDELALLMDMYDLDGMHTLCDLMVVTTIDLVLNQGKDLDGNPIDLTTKRAEGAKAPNLSNTRLEGADLGSAHLEGAVLCEAHLEGAVLGGAHLEGADLCEKRMSVRSE